MAFPFVGAAYTSRSLNISAQQCVNLYPEVQENHGEKGVARLIGTPGLVLKATAPNNGPIRGMHVPASGSAIVVAGNTVYRLSTGYAWTSAGTLATSSGVVSIEDNGTTAVLVDGPNGYTLTLATNVLTQITAAGWRGSDQVRYMDNFFLLVDPDTQVNYIMGVGATTLDPLDFASAEGAPDNTVAHLVDHREWWQFGEVSTEIWRNGGNADYPFERMDGAFIEVGCAAKHSVAKLDNSVFWLGKDKNGGNQVYRANGYSPQRLSTHALEAALAGYSTTSDAVAWTYQQEGHTFYVLTFPTASRTWVFDASTGLWHERAWHDSLGRQQRHRGASHIYFSGKNLVGDWENGKIYALELDTYTDNGDAIHAIRSAPHIATGDYDWLFFSDLQVEFEAGVGLQSGQGNDPQAMLSWSNDGGHTWSNELWRSIGKVGEYTRRALWNQLGRARSRTFRVRITDPVKRIIIGASVQAEKG